MPDAPLEPDYAANPNQRTPCVLVLDASTSMQGDPINHVNAGIEHFVDEVSQDTKARERLQIAAICVGGPTPEAEVILDWTDAKDLQPFQLEAGHATPLGQGVNRALDMVKDQTKELRENGVNCLRPWIVIMTDGQPNDSGWEQAAGRAREAQDDGKCVIFPLAVGNCRTDILQLFATTPVKALDGYRFEEFFQWLSTSLRRVSTSGADDKVQMPATDPWEAVQT